MASTIPGTTGERRVELVDNFLDLGRNLVPDNIFRASLQSAITKYSEGENTRLKDTHSNNLVVKTLEYRQADCHRTDQLNVSR